MCNSKSPNNPVLQARGVGGGFSEENAVVSAVLMGLGLGWGWGSGWGGAEDSENVSV